MANVGGKIIAENQTFSLEQLNQKMIARMTGDEMSLHDISHPLNISCLQDGSTFEKGHFYIVDDDENIYDVFKEHKHTTAKDGGTIYNILHANAKDLIGFDNSAGINTKDFNKSTDSANGAVFTDQMDTNELYTLLTTGNVADDYVNAIKGGGRISFAKPITMQIKYGVSHDVDSLMVIGTSINEVQNDPLVGAQILFEFCSGSGNNQIGITSADGTTRSTEYLDTVIQPVPFGMRFDFYPGSKIYAIDGEGLEVNKTSNPPPTSAGSTSNRLFRAGIKSNNTTPKSLRLYAARLFGNSFDSQTGIYGWI